MDNFEIREVGPPNNCPGCGEWRNEGVFPHVCFAQRDYFAAELAKIIAEKEERSMKQPEFLLCGELGVLATKHGECPEHGGDACLHRYERMGDPNDTTKALHAILSELNQSVDAARVGGVEERASLFGGVLWNIKSIASIALGDTITKAPEKASERGDRWVKVDRMPTLEWIEKMADREDAVGGGIGAGTPDKFREDFAAYQNTAELLTSGPFVTYSIVLPDEPQGKPQEVKKMMTIEERITRIEKSTTIKIAVQVDGKFVGSFDRPLGNPNDPPGLDIDNKPMDQKGLSIECARLVAKLDRSDIVRTVYIQDKLVGFWTTR